MQPTASTRGAIERVLVDSHDRFLAFVRSKIADPQTAQDILQDSMLKAIQASESLKTADSVVPWFYRILRNSITDAYRSHGKHEATVDIELAGDIEADSEEFKALCLCFQDLLSNLRPEYASAIQRLDLEQVPVGVEAQRLGISANALKVRRHRARQALRRQIEQVCRVCADHHCVDCSCKSA